MSVDPDYPTTIHRDIGQRDADSPLKRNRLRHRSVALPATKQAVPDGNDRDPAQNSGIAARIPAVNEVFPRRCCHDLALYC